MTRIRLRAVLPLLLLAGVAAPAQAEVALSVDCADCDLVPQAIVLVVDQPLAHAMEEDAECQSAVYTATRSLSVDVAVTDVPQCPGDVILYSFEFEGWHFVTSQSTLTTRTYDSDSDGGGGGSPCSSIVLGNILKQIGDNPVGAIANSISINTDCELMDLVWSLIR